MTFYFYDLETTGFNPREGRIMQFAGQRTSKNLKPIGEPDNLLIKLTEDILPDPDATLVTGITPQQTIESGLTEAEFCKRFASKINQSETVFVGYNNIRFDDEFMRHLFYRNFYDAYEWQWQDQNSRWDLLDVVRMTRALRPAGINWPFAGDGSPSNQLGLVTAVNKLEHSNAHEALADVRATIAVARLIHERQPKLFDFLLKMRGKVAISDLVSKPEPFVYTSGKYPSQYEKTTVVVALADHPKRGGALVYDLRHDPTPFAQMSVSELAKAWRRRDPEEGLTLPVKTLQFNRCPAIAPLNVLDDKSKARLQINLNEIAANHKKLLGIKKWPERLLAALEILDKEQQVRLIPDQQNVDNQLYEGFFDKADKRATQQIRQAEPDELRELLPTLKDKRLQAMLPLYKARNFEQQLTSDELKAWQQYRKHRLTGGGKNSRLNRYLARIEEIGQQPKLNPDNREILRQLKLYGKSVTKFD